MKWKQVLAHLGLAALFAACSSSNNAPAVQQCSSTGTMVTEANSIASGSDNGSCARLFNWGNGAAGSACTDPLQCAPTCCACASAGKSALTSWCNHGTCAAAGDVCCALAGTPTHSCGF